MANLLEEIGRGLKIAGGVASPRVFEANVAEDQQRRELEARRQDQFQRIKEARSQLILQYAARAAENGSITPDAFQKIAQKYGGEVMPAMGPSVQTQKTQADMAREQRLTQYRQRARQSAFAKPSVVGQSVSGEGAVIGEGGVGTLDPVNIDMPAPISERQMTYADELIASGEPELVKEGTDLKRAIAEKDAKQSPLGLLIAERKQVAAQYGENHPIVKQYDARIQKETSDSAAERNVQFVELPTGRTVNGKPEVQNYAVLGRNEDGTPKLVPQGKPAPKGSLVDVNVGPLGGLTPGQKKADEKYAEEYVEWNASGGYADVLKSLEQLRGISKRLTTESLTGPITGNVPDSIQAFTNPAAIAAREDVQEVAQRNLRLVLGAQFTEKEGEKLIARVYNPILSEATNKKRVDRLIRQIEAAALAKQDAAKYFEEHGTLQGWKGKKYTLKDFDPDIEEKPTETWEDSGYRYRRLPDGTVQRNKKLATGGKQSRVRMMSGRP